MSSCTKSADELSANTEGEAQQLVIAYCYQPQRDDIHQIYTIHEDGSSQQKVIDASIGLNHQDLRDLSHGGGRVRCASAYGQ